MMRVTFFLGAAVTIVGTSAFGLQRSRGIGGLDTSCRSSLASPAVISRGQITRLSATSKGPGKVDRPQNEFSRTYRTESVLGGGPRQRDYQMSVEATEEERSALAKRFDLSDISKLEAELSMRREPNVKGSSNRGEKKLCERKTCL